MQQIEQKISVIDKIRQRVPILSLAMFGCANAAMQITVYFDFDEKLYKEIIITSANLLFFMALLWSTRTRTKEPIIVATQEPVTIENPPPPTIQASQSQVIPPYGLPSILTEYKSDNRNTQTPSVTPYQPQQYPAHQYPVHQYPVRPSDISQSHHSTMQSVGPEFSKDMS